MAPFGTDSLRAVGSAGRIWSWGYIVSTTFCQYITSAGFLIIKWTRYYANFSNLFLEWNSTCFGQFLCPSSGVFHFLHSNGICHTGLLRTAVEQDQDGRSWSCSTAVSKLVWHIPLLCVQWKTPDDGQRNCPKRVDFNSKNKFEKLVHLIGFIIMNIFYYFLSGQTVDLHW